MKAIAAILLCIISSNAALAMVTSACRRVATKDAMNTHAAIVCHHREWTDRAKAMADGDSALLLCGDATGNELVLVVEEAIRIFNVAADEKGLPALCNIVDKTTRD